MFTLLTHRLCSLAYGEAGAQLPQSSCCEQSVLIAPRVNEFSVHICDHCYNPLPTGYCETLDSHFKSAKWTDSNNSTYSGKAVADQQLMLKVFLIIIMRLINNNKIKVSSNMYVYLYLCRCHLLAFQRCINQAITTRSLFTVLTTAIFSILFATAIIQQYR